MTQPGSFAPSQHGFVNSLRAQNCNEQLNRLLRLAAAVLNVPRVLVTHATPEGSRCLASFGFGDTTRLQQFIDDHCEQDRAVRTAASQAETFEFHIPLVGERNQLLGTLWLLDDRVRDLSELEQGRLRDVASLICDLLGSSQGPDLGDNVVEPGMHVEKLIPELLGTLLVFFGVLDLDGTFVDVSKRTPAAANIEAEDMLGHPLWECPCWNFSEDVQRRLREGITRAGAGMVVRSDFDAQLADRTRTTVDLLLSPLRDATGRIANIIVCGIDASHRDQAEAELHRMARIVEEAPFLIRSATPDGRVLYLNRHGRQILGYSPSSDLRNAEVSHHHPDWAMRVLRNDGYPTAREDGQWLGQTAIIDTDGREVPVSHAIVAHRGGAGGVEYFSSIAIDISAQKSAEEALRESELRFRGTFENAAVGMAHLRLDGRWLRVNERLLEIVGYGRAELVQMSFQDLTHPDDVKANLDLFQRLKDGEIDSYSLEKRYYRKDGSVVWIEITVSMQETSGQTEAFMIAIIEDISERKDAEQRQNLLLAELNHRVKNTLAMIQSIANQSLRQTADPRAFVAGFTGRLQSLSKAHDLLTAQTWDGADLAALLRTQVTLNGTVDQERVKLSGPSVLLSPQVALNLAIIIHELAANALQHGAFANDSGKVDLVWSLATTPAADGKLLEIIWAEHGGLPVIAPSKRGFGTIILERGLKQGLGGNYQIEWAPDGLIARLSVPLPESGYRKDLFAT